MNSVKNIKVRLANQEDAKSMLEIQRAVLAEGQFLMTTIDKFNETVSGQTLWTQSKLGNVRVTILVAEVNNCIVGWLVFQSPKRTRLAHTGSVGMMVAKEYRGRGIGELLLKALLDWAE